MLVNSTGLGKTTLEAHVADFVTVKHEGERYVQLVIESDKPVHWHITVKMSGSDIRQVVGMTLKNIFLLPKILWYMAFR